MYNYVKESKKWQVTYMKPRIFISSTFYDLKYIREDLSNFVRQHDYEPIMFENGDIGYTPGKTLDKSCYDSMKNSDMVILIIGGEYGSPASGEKKDDFKEYMSVTRNEFRTAIDAGIPVFVMINKKVMAEYNVYELNYEEIENKGQKIKFSSVKNINVFRFIKEIRSMSILPIQEFERSSEIKDFIGKQWADMFKNYLSMLRGEREDKKIEGSVNELKILVQQMGVMLDSVGKNVLSKDNSNKYDEVVKQQEIISFCNIIISSFFIKGKITDKNTFSKEHLIKLFLEFLKNQAKIDLYIEDRRWLDLTTKEFRKYGFATDMSRYDDTFIIKKTNMVYLLEDNHNFEKIVKILSNDEFFFQLFKIKNLEILE